ncbi:MAG: hypothetical protein MUO24_00550, partial [Desulfobacterales bacterium]|nr:hypothetical protein [Desulfobacterales bacterium]
MGNRDQGMKRLHDVGVQRRLLMATPQSAMRGLLRSGGFSFLLHVILIIFLICYLKAGSPNGGEGGNGSGSSGYRVIIRPISSQNKTNPPSLRELAPSQAVFTRAQIKKDEDGSRKKEKPPAPIPMASTAQLSARDESGAGVGESAIQEGHGSRGQGDGTGTGDGTGAGWNILGLRGFDSAGVSAPRYMENPKPEYPP